MVLRRRKILFTRLATELTEIFDLAVLPQVHDTAENGLIFDLASAFSSSFRAEGLNILVLLVLSGCTYFESHTKLIRYNIAAKGALDLSIHETHAALAYAWLALTPLADAPGR